MEFINEGVQRGRQELGYVKIYKQRVEIWSLFSDEPATSVEI